MADDVSGLLAGFIAHGQRNFLRDQQDREFAWKERLAQEDQVAQDHYNSVFKPQDAGSTGAGQPALPSGGENVVSPRPIMPVASPYGTQSQTDLLDSTKPPPGADSQGFLAGMQHGVDVTHALLTGGGAPAPAATPPASQYPPHASQAEIYAIDHPGASVIQHQKGPPTITQAAESRKESDERTYKRLQMEAADAIHQDNPGMAPGAVQTKSHEIARKAMNGYYPDSAAPWQAEAANLDIAGRKAAVTGAGHVQGETEANARPAGGLPGALPGETVGAYNARTKGAAGTVGKAEGTAQVPDLKATAGQFVYPDESPKAGQAIPPAWTPEHRQAVGAVQLSKDAMTMRPNLAVIDSYIRDMEEASKRLNTSGGPGQLGKAARTYGEWKWGAETPAAAAYQKLLETQATALNFLRMLGEKGGRLPLEVVQQGKDAMIGLTDNPTTAAEKLKFFAGIRAALQHSVGIPMSGQDKALMLRLDPGTLGRIMLMNGSGSAPPSAPPAPSPTQGKTPGGNTFRVLE